MTKNRSQQLSEKAAAERQRCREWLLPFMQVNQPKFLTKDELRGAACENSAYRRTPLILDGSTPSKRPAVTIGMSLTLSEEEPERQQPRGRRGIGGTKPAHQCDVDQRARRDCCPP
jgi:hypothetical protein